MVSSKLFDLNRAQQKSFKVPQNSSTLCKQADIIFSGNGSRNIQYSPDGLLLTCNELINHCFIPENRLNLSGTKCLMQRSAGVL